MTAVSQRGLRAVTVAGAAVVLAIVSAACVTTAEPTPIYIYITPTPSATMAETAAPVETQATEPTAVPETPTPLPAGSPTSEATQAPTPESTLAPGATPAPGGASCTGTADNQAFFVQAANGLKFTVYCVTGLPSGWTITVGNWAYNKYGGSIDVNYRYKKTSETFTVTEGAFCLTGPGPCSPNTGTIGPASFGGLAATLYSTSGGLAIYSSPGTTHAYQITATDVPQATLTAISAAMMAVPKS
jgi:hypothetical protein